MTERPFAAEQRRVAAGIGVALAVVVAVFAWGLADPQPAGGASRAVLAGRCLAVIGLCLAAAIGDVARRRFLSPQDIAGSAAGPGSAPVARAVAVLQNTAEQAVLAMAAQVALIATLPGPGRLGAVLPALFVVGRMLFAAGYRRGAGARAFGFALTFFPSIIGLVVALWFAVR